MKENTTKLSIKEWAEEDRPREKLLQKGVLALSDAELLAILIGSGNSTESAVQLSQRVLYGVRNNLKVLGKLSVKELTASYKGIGTAKAVTILAALELGKRRMKSPAPKQDSIQTSRDAYNLLYQQLNDLPYEELWILLTNRSGKVIEKVKISQGGTDETAADLRLILKSAIQNLASGIIMCHNHPSGNRLPSKPDDRLTARVQQAANLIDITLLDHIIIADKSYYSYADEGRL